MICKVGDVVEGSTRHGLTFKGTVTSLRINPPLGLCFVEVDGQNNYDHGGLFGLLDDDRSTKILVNSHDVAAYKILVEGPELPKPDPKPILPPSVRG